MLKLHFEHSIQPAVGTFTAITDPRKNIFAAMTVCGRMATEIVLIKLYFCVPLCEDTFCVCGLSLLMTKISKYHLNFKNN